MISKFFLSFLIVVFFLSFPLRAQEKVTIPCKVMEIQGAQSSSSEVLRDIRYVLIHHADLRDRDTLSRCLKKGTTHEVNFFYQGQKHKGILFRLDHCFGRGLLIYREDIKLTKGETIDLECPYR